MQKLQKKSKKHGMKQYLQTISIAVIPFTLLLIYVGAFILIFTKNDISIENIKNVFTNKIYVKSLIYSTYITLISTLLSLIIGTYIVKKLGNIESIILKCLIFIPHFIIAYYVYELLGNKISWSLNVFGLPIIIAYVLKEVPFVVLYLLPIMNNISSLEYDQVTILGANKFTTFKTVTLPKLIPAYTEITIILVSFILFAFETPFLLGVSFPKFISIIVYQSFFDISVTLKTNSIIIMSVVSLMLVVFSVLLLALTKKYRKTNYKSRSL